ncbi:hypothetical protein GCM10007874_25240 [Labrys miyagiensis]|uniref:Uncharacterized protein n=1 Tax=Labrys miyagiensis TaxID=346912 RepID=A0ABQ6CIQ9_9HYPH|nr:hypothetical protein [Labrys miyagiensis]GLS19507.1 hypothetical protein GCM10007874_25240 [Labrys miyagiensis]
MNAERTVNEGGSKRPLSFNPLLAFWPTWPAGGWGRERTGTLADFATGYADYVTEATQRSIVLVDLLRQHGNPFRHLEYSAAGMIEASWKNYGALLDLWKEAALMTAHGSPLLRAAVGVPERETDTARRPTRVEAILYPPAATVEALADEAEPEPAPAGPVDEMPVVAPESNPAAEEPTVEGSEDRAAMALPSGESDVAPHLTPSETPVDEVEPQLAPGEPADETLAVAPESEPTTETPAPEEPAAEVPQDKPVTAKPAAARNASIKTSARPATGTRPAPGRKRSEGNDAE